MLPENSSPKSGTLEGKLLSHDTGTTVPLKSILLLSKIYPPDNDNPKLFPTTGRLLSGFKIPSIILIPLFES